MSETTKAPDSTEKSTKERLLQLRNADLHKRFDELYKKKRIRHDDVLEQLSKEFYITPRTIREILKIPAEVPAQLKPGEQADLFVS